MNSNNASIGARAEDYIARHLTNNDYSIVARNVMSKYGEIDLIALYKNILVAVEVKYRKSTFAGHPLEHITTGKIKKIITTLDYFLMSHSQFRRYSIRIDAITILNTDGKITVDWIKNISSDM